MKGSLIFGGLAMVAAAALISSDAVERTLLGRATGELAWGPALFRGLLAFHGAVLVLAGLCRRGGRSGDRAVDPVPDIGRSQPLFDRRAWLWMGLLTVAAIVLRAWKLNSPLWLDEILTLTDFVRPSLGRIVTSFPNQNQHLLYSLLGHASVSLFGENVWSLRLPAVVFGVGSIWALYLLARRALSVRESILACALMTFSYHHIWFSQNARGYSGLLCFATLATWLWLEARERNGLAWWSGYVASVVAGMLLHSTMAFVVASHVAVYGLEIFSRGGRAHWARPILAWGLAVTLTLQCFALAMPQFVRFGLHEPSMNSTWTDPMWVIREMVTHLKLGLGVAAVGAVAFLVAGWLSLVRANWRYGLLLVLPVVLSAGTMIALRHNIWPRFFFFAMGLALIIVVRGISVAARVPFLMSSRDAADRRAGLLATVVGVLVVAASSATIPRGYALPKQDYGGAREFVERSRGASDAVVSVGLAAKAYSRCFAPQWTNIESYPPTPGVRPLTQWSYCEQGKCRCDRTLERIMEDHASVWLTYTLVPELASFHPALYAMVQKYFRPVAVFPGTLSGGEVTVCRYDRMPSSSSAPGVTLDRNP